MLLKKSSTYYQILKLNSLPLVIAWNNKDFHNYYISLNKVSVSSIKFLDKLICNKDLYVKKYKDNNFYKNLIISNRKIIITLFIFNDLFICYFNDEKYIFNNSDINISVQYHNILNYIITYYDDKKDLLKTKRK